MRQKFRRTVMAALAGLAALALTPVPASGATAPEIDTGAGAGVGITSAVLHGELTAGSDTHIWVHWGPADESDPPSATNEVLVSESADAPYDFKHTLTGMLNPETTYAYRVAASNDVDTAESTWVEFTTQPADFVTVAEPAWFGGGWYDGFDADTRELLIERLSRGTLMLIR